MNKNNYTDAKKKGYLVWCCPKCKDIIKIESYPAISRKDGDEICSQCGTDEAFDDFKKNHHKKIRVA